jgi:hypothetical protein
MGTRYPIPFIVASRAPGAKTQMVWVRSRPAQGWWWVGDGREARGREGEKSPPLGCAAHLCGASGSPDAPIAVGRRQRRPLGEWRGAPRRAALSGRERSSLDPGSRGRARIEGAAHPRGQTRGRTLVRDWRQVWGQAHQTRRDPSLRSG